MLLHHCFKSQRGLECTFSLVGQNRNILVSFTPKPFLIWSECPLLLFRPSMGPISLPDRGLPVISVTFFAFLTWHLPFHFHHLARLWSIFFTFSEKAVFCNFNCSASQCNELMWHGMLMLDEEQAETWSHLWRAGDQLNWEQRFLARKN